MSDWKKSLSNWTATTTATGPGWFHILGGLPTEKVGHRGRVVGAAERELCKETHAAAVRPAVYEVAPARRAGRTGWYAAVGADASQKYLTPAGRELASGSEPWVFATPEQARAACVEHANRLQTVGRGPYLPRGGSGVKVKYKGSRIVEIAAPSPMRVKSRVTPGDVLAAKTAAASMTVEDQEVEARRAIRDKFVEQQRADRAARRAAHKSRLARQR